MFKNKLALGAIAFAMALTLGTAACENDVPEDIGLVDVCEGNECDLDALGKAAPKMQDCDVFAAAEHYEVAWAKQFHDDGKNLEIALGRAIAGTLALAKEPSFQSLLKKLGFKKPEQIQCLWQEYGVFDMMHIASEEDIPNCTDDEAERFCKDLEHPGLGEGGVTLSKTIKTISGDLTVNELTMNIADLKEKFISLSNTFKYVADNMEEPLISLMYGGCGLEKFKFSKTDLYTFAALLRLVPSATEFFKNYKHEIKIKDILRLQEREPNSYCSSFKNIWKDVNDSLFVLKSKAKMEDSTLLLQQAAELIKTAMNSISHAQGQVGIIAWKEMPKDMEALIKGFSGDLANAIKDDTALNLAPYIKSALTFHVNKFFANPFDRKADNKIAENIDCKCSPVENNDAVCFLEPSVETNWEFIATTINNVTSPALYTKQDDGEFIIGLDIELKLDLEDLEMEKITDPHHYIQNIDQCMQGGKE
ncbi:MAG: hypothetical protein WC966_09950 [Bradymonadales bacterium]